MGFWLSMGIYGCHGSICVFTGIYGFDIWTLKILPIFSFKTARRLRNPRSLKSHMYYKKKKRMHHGGEGFYRSVCFQYLFPACTEQLHSSIKSLFSPVVHNILLCIGELAFCAVMSSMLSASLCLYIWFMGAYGCWYDSMSGRVSVGAYACL